MRPAVIALFVCISFFAKGQQVYTVVPTSTAEPADTIHLCASDTFPVLLSSIEPTMYTPTLKWLFNGEPIVTDNSNSRTIHPAENGAYTLLVTGYNIYLEKTVVIDRVSYTCETIIPNVFTPNGDGHNDNFSILNIEHYPNSTLEVYARWGRKVFVSNNYRNEWNGADQADGTYFFVFKRNDGQEFKGSVTILR